MVLYDVNRNVYKQVPPLPYPVSGMATVPYGEFIVLAGLFDCNDLNTQPRTQGLYSALAYIRGPSKEPGYEVAEYSEHVQHEGLL